MNKYENKLKFIHKSFFVVVAIVSSIGTYLFFDTSAFAIEDGSSGWNWTNGVAEVYSSKDVSEISPGNCDGVLQSIGVYPLIGNKMACIQNSGTIRIGYYFDNNSTRYVVSYPLDNIFYQLEFPCSYPGECMYMPSSDSLATRQYLINGYVKSLVIYKNVSKRIKLTPASTFQFEYTFDNSNPDYIFQNTAGYPWPIGGFGASDNGRWVAFEIRERGIGLLDMQTMELKRVTSDYFRYNMGYNPTTDYAVSDTGKQVAQMGYNSGITIFDLSDGCGDIVDNDTMWPDYVQKTCNKVSINPDAFINRFYVGLYPRFSNDGAELSFYAISYIGGSKEVVLRAKNFTPQRVDYLAMGDSFTSGEGEFDDKYYQKGTNTEFEKCHVSSRSYPFKIAMLSNLDMQFVKSVACSGARTIDVIDGGKKYFGQGGRLGPDGLNLNESEFTLAQTYAKYNFFQGRIHQRIFVEQYRPGIVTVGIGGNDVGLVQKLQSCIGIEVCEEATSHKRKKQVAAEIKRLYPKLVLTYSSLHKDSPNSRIFVIGYPKVVSETGNCGLVLGKLLSIEERKFFNESIKYLNQIIESAAKTVGVKYVDNYETFGDGVICGSNNQKAINDFRIGDDIGINDGYKWTRIIGAESFHPNPNGFSLIAGNFMSSIGNINTSKVCPGDENVCPTATPAPEPPDYWGSSAGENLPMLLSEDFVEVSDISSDSKFRNLQLASYSLQPNSVLEVSIYSEKSVIGEYLSDENGGFDQEIELPQGLEYGFHTIHIVGKSFSGEDIDLYQSITYFDKNLTVGPSNNYMATTNNNDIKQIKELILQDVDYTSDAPASTVEKIDFSKASIKGATDQQISQKTAQHAEVNNDSLIFIGIGMVVAGVFGCGLLLNRFKSKL